MKHRLLLVGAAVLLLSGCVATTSQGRAGNVRAVSLDPAILTRGTEAFQEVQQQLCDTGANLVGLSAGRLDWNYFRWEGHEQNWAAQLRNSLRDPVKEAVEALELCPTIDHTSAIIDMFAPRYIEAHPEAAAYSASGNRIDYQVSSVALAHGDFGEQLLEMVEYIARYLSVDSVTLTELFYYQEGYGEDDLQSFLEFSGLDDWPRLDSGAINIEAPEIGEWRSWLVGGFVRRAAAITHLYGKELFVDVRVSWDDLDDRGRKHGQDYQVLLNHADRLVLWVYLGLRDHPHQYIHEIAEAYQHYGRENIILSLGMWGGSGSVISAHDLSHQLGHVLNSPLPGAWITPASLLDDSHWRVLEAVWAP